MLITARDANSGMCTAKKNVFCDHVSTTTLFYIFWLHLNFLLIFFFECWLYTGYFPLSSVQEGE